MKSTYALERPSLRSPLSEGWQRVSKAYPCPVCGKPDNCCVSEDGRAVWCGRISDGSAKENFGGQYLHFLDSDLSPVNPQSRRQRPRQHRFSDEWEELAAELAEGAATRIDALATELGVSPQALRNLQVGYSDRGQYWSFPERNAAGQVIGIQRRFRDGSKRRLRGSEAGLTYANDWSLGVSPVLLVEGASDVAAAITLGLSAIGRPSNSGGIPLLVEMLKSLPSTRPIIVLGERDQKPSGLWPGREGAIHTAQQLVERLQRPVEWALPPNPAKDIREWLLLEQ